MKMAQIPIRITRKDKILIIAPHPDDECIGTGGILSLYPKLCDVVVMTDGRQGGCKDSTPEIMKDIRKMEFENEMKYAGVHDFRMLEYEDGTLMQQSRCMQDIDFTGYTKIFIPWGDDNHPDHTAVCLYAVNKMKQQHIVDTEVYQYEVHVPFHDATHTLDITSCIENKMRLIQFHNSQVSCVHYDKMAKALGKYRACQSNFPGKYFEVYLQIDIAHDSIDSRNIVRENLLQKYIQFYKVLLRWMSAKQRGIDIQQYLKLHKIETVAIYGYADLGKLLCKELRQSDIKITALLDKRELESLDVGMTVQSPAAGDRNVDAVLVTAVFYYDEIRTELRDMGYKNILSLQKILEELG